MRHPGDLVAAGDQRGAQIGVAAAVGDVPLPGRDDLERLVALLVEVRDALGGLSARRRGRRRRGARRPTISRAVNVVLPESSANAARPCVVGDPLRHVAQDAAVATDDRAVGQLQLAPPLDVGEVAERAAHGDAGALVHLGGVVGEDRHLDAEQRRADGGAEQVLVALVVRVRDERDAGGDQLGAGGLDVDRSVGVVVRDPVVGAGVVAGLELGLGDGGLVGDVPQRRGVLLVGLAAGDVAQERALARRSATPRRSSCTSGSSRPTAPACARGCSNTFSSSTTSSLHRSMKLRRLIDTWRFGSGSAGGVKSGS